MADQWAAAFVTGMLATVNPCGFAMLPGFLAFYLGADTEQGPRRPVTAGLSAGAALSLGFAAVFTVSGLLLAIGLRLVIGWVPWLAVAVGAVLVTVGILQVFGRGVLGGRWTGVSAFANGVARRGDASSSLIGYGAAYAIAAMSCSLALLLALVAQATATGNMFALLSVFAAYAAGASVILTLLAVTAALARETLLRSVHRLMPIASRIGGAALAAAGVYLLSYWLPVLTGGSAGGPVSDFATALSAETSAFVRAHVHGLTIALAAVVAVWVGLALTGRARDIPSAQPSATQASDDCCAPTWPTTSAAPRAPRR